MMTPRQKVQSFILASLQTIQKAEQYHTDVVTVVPGGPKLRETNLTDRPALILWDSGDEPELSRNGGETQGGREGNQFFRLTNFLLYAILSNPGDLDLDDAGELFIADIQKCLIRNRFNQQDNRFPEDIHFSFKTSNFERIEFQNAVAEFKLRVKYNFREADL